MGSGVKKIKKKSHENDIIGGEQLLLKEVFIVHRKVFLKKKNKTTHLSL